MFKLLGTMIFGLAGLFVLIAFPQYFFIGVIGLIFGVIMLNALKDVNNNS